MTATAATSVAHAQFLRLLGQGVEGTVSVAIKCSPVVEDVLGVDAAMRSHLSGGDFSTVQQSNQEWPRNVEELSGLLGREFDTERKEGDRVAFRHLGQDVPEQA